MNYAEPAPFARPEISDERDERTLFHGTSERRAGEKLTPVSVAKPGHKRHVLERGAGMVSPWSRPTFRALRQRTARAPALLLWLLGGRLRRKPPFAVRT
jgi:hypothetical protein